MGLKPLCGGLLRVLLRVSAEFNINRSFWNEFAIEAYITTTTLRYTTIRNTFDYHRFSQITNTHTLTRAF